MADTKVTQLPIEPVLVPDDANVRLSQYYGDVAGLPTDANVRVSQYYAEVGCLPTTAKVRMSQIYIELILPRNAFNATGGIFPEYLKRYMRGGH